MNPENKKLPAKQPFNRLTDQLFKQLTNAIFYLAILFFMIGFNFSDRMVGNWYQQFLPNINGATLRDITFTDSLTGYSVTSIGGSNSYILKTTNSGDNWSIKYMHTQPFVKVRFINANTGFTNAFQTIFKTTNAGENWTPINLPGIFGDDMFVLNQDTIWLAMSESLTGGVFRTTNGGVSWDQQGNFGSSNPSHIYMYNSRIGFIDGLKKTTNSGLNWLPIAGSEPSQFFDMFFTDSLSGWKCHQQMRKTTDGGLNWVNQIIPSGGNIVISQIIKFDNIINDTIWSVGSTIITGSGGRGTILRTVNGGNNWLFQVPDSNINIFQYQHIDFTKPLTGWAYTGFSGIHTTFGGDPVWLTAVHQISSEVPLEYKLYNNYPNPFNPVTKIKYQIVKSKNVKIVFYDIQGKQLSELVNQPQQAGTYEVDFNGSSYSSGIYFYSLIIEGKAVDTKKMALVK